MTRTLWRSLDERGRPDAPAPHETEPRPGARDAPDGFTRREFLRVMAASIALAGTGGCGRAPDEEIVPYVRTPSSLVPGNPSSYATAATIAGFGIGVLATSREGRPTKIEGNPDHPASLGATDALLQASILDLYDPDRSRTPLVGGAAASWERARAELLDRVARHRERGGRGLRLLTGAVTSPTTAELLSRLGDEMPQALRHAYEPLDSTSALWGARAAFGEAVVARLRLDRAEVVLSLDADFLGAGPARVRDAWDFAASRRVRRGTTKRCRLYVVETAPSITGAAADHRFPMRPTEIARFARALLRRIDGGVADPRFPWLDAVARDLEAHRGTAVVVAGDAQSEEVHAVACAVNDALGAIGRTIDYIDPVQAAPLLAAYSLPELRRDVEAGRVETLLVLGVNPAYDAPADVEFADLLRRVEFTFHMGLHADETAAACRVHVPQAHFLESWDDVRAFDGTASIVQPLIAPLHDGRTIAEIAALVLAGVERPAYELVREHWRTRITPPGGTFETAWRRALRDGVVEGTAAATRPVGRRAAFVVAEPDAASQPGIEVAFRPDPSVLDGRFANNAWLQELPRPLTKLVWDNAALVSPRTAERLGLAAGDVVSLTLRGRTIEAPAWIAPGHADDCVTLPLGYGRTRAGRVGTGVGFNAYALRTWTSPWNDVGLDVRRTGARRELACTQEHHSVEGRDLVHAGALDEFVRDPTLGRGPAVVEPSLYPARPWSGAKWAMSIDLGACIGCNACVVACTAENNVPVVGRREVMRGREMHWIRIDTYFQGDPSNPKTFHQPLPCMQCENAPCEVVCPVGATVHSHEGLNDMVYNRCVGTRYCSNNCPWKVRRFNFFAYADAASPPQELARNPDVTVRARGVMEKCTYCVQRIDRARIDAKKADRRVADGDVVTACQGACPTKAIVFGDGADPTSRVAADKAEPHDYALLGHLGARPRTTYLAHVGNPNPAIRGA